MRGAVEYGDIFELRKEKCFGNLVIYLWIAHDLYGAKFILDIYVKEPSKWFSKSKLVQVYGSVSYNTCNWIHKGPWQEDFEKIIEKLRAEKAKEKKREEAIRDKILSSYKSEIE